MPSLFAMRHYANPVAACAPLSPIRPRTVLEKARHGLAANPIDRSDPIRERAIKQERADDELLSKKDEEDNTISDVFNQPQHFVAPAVLVPNVATHNAVLARYGAAFFTEPVQLTLQGYPGVPNLPIAHLPATRDPNFRAQALRSIQDLAPEHAFNPFIDTEDLPEVYTPGRQWPPAMTFDTVAPIRNTPIPRRAVRQPSPRTPIRRNRPCRPIMTGSLTPQRLASYATMAAAAPTHEPDAQQYSELANAYMGSLLWSLEDTESNRPDMEVEEAAGVVSVIIANVGTYIINKQPPNKQIWLSSPISGPKRFDYRDLNGDGGKWVYGRDGSSLTQILNDELALGYVAEGEGKQWVESTQKFE